jgi:hypothetical protein
MKKLLTPTNAKLALLTEELFDAFPEWRYRKTLFDRDTGVEREVMATNVSITSDQIVFPDDTPEAEVQAVLQKHDHTKPSRNETARQARLDEINRANSVDDLKRILKDML